MPAEEHLRAVGVSEGTCQHRTGEILLKLDTIGKGIIGVDKKIDGHLAFHKGKEAAEASQKKSSDSWARWLGFVLAALLGIGGIAYTAGKLSQPSVDTLIQAYKAAKKDPSQ